VRAALERLRREGYIVEQPGKRRARIIIAPLTTDDARELYELIGHLESLAGARVAGQAAAARAALATELAGINAELSVVTSAPDPDPRGVFGIDKRFHGAVVAAAGGRRLATLHASVGPQVDRYWRLYATSILSQGGRSIAEHDEIVASIRKGDANAIQRALTRNWTGGFERIRSLIEIFGERGSW
jgi:DNA-binding GntR family transcriptional regulator